MRLKASNLAVERGGRIIFSNLSFTLGQGECIFVTGQNGAGKSTLLRAIAGLLPVARGSISLDPNSSEIIAEQIHYVGHADALKATLTVTENLNFFAALLDGGRQSLAAGPALAAVGLGHVADLPAAYLSAGQKRRVALARLLVAHRPLWLLDEPSTALDTNAQALVAKIMAAHLAEGGMIMAATHAQLDLEGRELRLGAQA
jgi:heme exporter protein A